MGVSATYPRPVGDSADPDSNRGDSLRGHGERAGVEMVASRCFVFPQNTVLTNEAQKGTLVVVMPVQVCKICEKQFYVRPSFLEIGWGQYCSQKCKGASQKNGKAKPCASCGKDVYRTPRDFSRNSISKKFFCNKSCFAIWKNKTLFVGSGHPLWKFGHAAYRATMLRRGGSPVCSSCGFNDVRALLVHHKDRNRRNNTPRNLKWLCHNCHYLEHEGRTI